MIFGWVARIERAVRQLNLSCYAKWEELPQPVGCSNTLDGITAALPLHGRHLPFLHTDTRNTGMRCLVAAGIGPPEHLRVGHNTLLPARGFESENMPGIMAYEADVLPNPRLATTASKP